MKHGGKMMPFTIAALTMVPGLTLAVLVDAHVGIEIMSLRAGLPWAPTTQTGLFCLAPVQVQRKNFSSENTTRLKSKGRTTDREHAPALQHVTAKLQDPAKRFSDVNLGARTGLKQSRLEIVMRDMSSELGQRTTLKVCRGFSFTAVSISAPTSLVRHRFSAGAPRRRCFSFGDQSGLCACISRGA